MTVAADRFARPAEGFSPKVAIALFLVGVFSFSAFITLSTFAPELADGNDAAAHALSRSAIGYAGVVKLLRARGDSVTVSRGATKPSNALVVLTPKSKLMATDIAKLAGRRALVVLPKWLAIPSMNHEGWVAPTEPMFENFVAEILADIAPEAEVKRTSGTEQTVIRFEPHEAQSLSSDADLRPGKIKDLQTITAKDIVAVAKDKDGRTVLGVIHLPDQPEIYVLSDPDFLNTQGIADIETARAGMAILDALRTRGAPIVFDVTLHGFERTRSLLRLAFEPPLLAATLSLLVAAALLAWRAATRDGPAAASRRAIALGKRALADNSAALIRLAGREHQMVRRYADLIRTTTAEKIGVARDGSDATAAELDRIGLSRGVKESYSALAAQAAFAQNGAAAVAAARNLRTWNEEIIRATR